MIKMSIGNTFDSARNKAAAIGIAAMVAFSSVASADDNVHKASLGSNSQCAPLLVAPAGYTIDASASAYKYSVDNPGAVGIPIFPGGDLPGNSPHALGTQLVTIFENGGVEAKCFVHNERHKSGSSINFKIDGLSWKEHGSLNIKEGTSLTVLKGVRAQANMVKTSASPPLALNQ